MTHFCSYETSVLVWGTCHRFSLYLELKVSKKLLDVSKENTESSQRTIKRRKEHLPFTPGQALWQAVIPIFEMEKLRPREAGSNPGRRTSEACFQSRDYNNVTLSP